MLTTEFWKHRRAASQDDLGNKSLSELWRRESPSSGRLVADLVWPLSLENHLHPGNADTLLSITQIAALLSPCYRTLYDQIREVETAFCRGFPTVWEISQTVDGPTQVDETQQCVRASKTKIRRGRGSTAGSPEGGRTRWTGEQGDELTLVAACRDVFRVVSAEERTDYDDELAPVIEEADDLSQPLGEVWTDGLPAYQGTDYDHQYVVHDDGYVSDEGVYTNQAECLWSLLQPWLAKFRGLSKQGMEQAARIYGFLRSLNVTRAPIPGLIDCVAANVFR